jgi:hypothetical protein
MKRIEAILVVVVAMAALSARAEHELVGFTTTAVKGDHRIANMTGLCQADFGGNARMCNDAEILQTTNWPAGLSGNGWVHPDIRGAVEITSLPNNAMGVAASGFFGDPLTLSCHNWSDGTSNGVGLLYSAAGSLFPAFVGVGCQDLHSVSCCAPAPGSMASVASLGLWGQGGLAAFVITAAAYLLIRRSPLPPPS